MAGFDVDDQALHAASFQLGVTADDLDSAFGVVRSQLGRIVDGGWRGSAGCAFAAGWDDWMRGYTDAIAALRTMSDLLRATGVVYATSEQDSVANVRAVGPAA